MLNFETNTLNRGEASFIRTPAAKKDLRCGDSWCARHGTVQDNITFGKRYDEEKFSKVWSGGEGVRDLVDVVRFLISVLQPKIGFSSCW